MHFKECVGIKAFEPVITAHGENPVFRIVKKYVPLNSQRHII